MRILIAENNPLMRSFLIESIQQAGYLTNSRDNGSAVMRAITREPSYDLVLLDVDFLTSSRTDIIQRVGEKVPTTRIILLSKQRCFEAALKGLRHHISDYLILPTTPQKLIQSIKRALQLSTELTPRGEVHAPDQLIPLEINGVGVNFSRRIIYWPGHQVALTPSEGRLLKVLTERPGRVLTQTELVEQIHGYHSAAPEAALVLRPLVSRLRGKLAKVPGGHHWIINVRGTGYLFERRASPKIPS